MREWETTFNFPYLHFTFIFPGPLPASPSAPPAASWPRAARTTKYEFKSLVQLCISPKNVIVSFQVFVWQTNIESAERRIAGGGGGAAGTVEAAGGGADLVAEKVRRAKREVHKADALAEKIQNKYQVWFLAYARSTLDVILICKNFNVRRWHFPVFVSIWVLDLC